MPRCPKGTRRNKKSGNCEPKKTSTKGTRQNKKTGDYEENTSSVSKGKKRNTLITTEDLDNIIDSAVQLSSDKRSELEAMKPRLRIMKYDPNYISCFTGNKTRDLINMIETKIQCWAKYGDDI